MRHNFSPMLAVLAAVTLIGSVGATTTLLQHQASAIIIIGGKIAQFQMLTAKMEKDVIKAVGDPNIKGGPAPHLIGDFAQLTAQLRTDVINAAQTDDTSAIRGIIINYDEAASRLLGGPDTKQLLDDYSDEVLKLFELAPRQ